jgi:hypothetical protein
LPFRGAAWFEDLERIPRVDVDEARKTPQQRLGEIVLRRTAHGLVADLHENLSGPVSRSEDQALSVRGGGEGSICSSRTPRSL